MKNRHIGYGLAALSIGLGTVELLAGKRVARALGVPKSSKVVRGFGVREIATGGALLASPASSAGAWARVAGDVLDLAALGAAARKPRARTGAIVGGLVFVGAALLADVAAGVAMSSKAA
ncbi:MAG: hypothetical protein JF593_06015 [Novosphingobium sp.]|nr:hypothetical protein [Novosphingobium sp.]